MNRHIITIVALGPDSAQQLTLGALEAMRNAKTLVLRTERHGVSAFLREQKIAYETLDALYEKSEDFDELCALVAKTIIEKARDLGSVCYAVSDPACDATVRVLSRTLPDDCTLQVVGGVSYAEQAACAVLAYGVDTENLRTITALSIDALRPQADTPQVIVEINDRWIASDVKLWLLDLFDDDTTVYFLENAAEGRAQPLLLRDIDRQPYYDHRTTIFVPAVSVYMRKRANYEDFVQIVARLRAPDGCPWDRAQTMHSLRRYMIEEACEAAEAMDGDDPLKVADELGDVLLQVVLVSAIAAEHREFTDRDVTSIVTRKMILRHEHVFGNVKAKDANAVTSIWENAKRRERGEQTPWERVMMCLSHCPL